jgi:hypothetical protein
MIEYDGTDKLAESGEDSKEALEDALKCARTHFGCALQYFIRWISTYMTKSSTDSMSTVSVLARVRTRYKVAL